MTTTSSTLPWIISRAAGTTAMVLASCAVGFGLVMGSKLAKRWGADRMHIHEILSLSTIAAIAVHGLALLGDSWLHPNLADIAIPFLAPYKTLYTSIGIVAGWGMVVLGLSYYARRRIGATRWKAIHRLTALAWLMALIHTFAEGTDAVKLWFVALIAITAAPGLVLLVVRHTRRPLAAPAPQALA